MNVNGNKTKKLNEKPRKNSICWDFGEFVESGLSHLLRVEPDFDFGSFMGSLRAAVV